MNKNVMGAYPEYNAIETELRDLIIRIATENKVRLHSVVSTENTREVFPLQTQVHVRVDCMHQRIKRLVKFFTQVRDDPRFLSCHVSLMYDTKSGLCGNNANILFSIWVKKVIQ